MLGQEEVVLVDQVEAVTAPLAYCGHLAGSRSALYLVTWSLFHFISRSEHTKAHIVDNNFTDSPRTDPNPVHKEAKNGVSA